MFASHTHTLRSYLGTSHSKSICLFRIPAAVLRSHLSAICDGQGQRRFSQRRLSLRRRRAIGEPIAALRQCRPAAEQGVFCQASMPAQGRLCGHSDLSTTRTVAYRESSPRRPVGYCASGEQVHGVLFLSGARRPCPSRSGYQSVRADSETRYPALS